MCNHLCNSIKHLMYFYLHIIIYYKMHQNKTTAIRTRRNVTGHDGLPIMHICENQLLTLPVCHGDDNSSEQVMQIITVTLIFDFFLSRLYVILSMRNGFFYLWLDLQNTSLDLPLKLSFEYS